MSLIIKFLRGSLSTRSFTLNDEYIEFHVPPAPLFKILWADFDEIYVKKRKEVTEILDETSIIHDLTFKGKGQDRTFALNTTRGMHRNVGDKILAIIQERAAKMGKKFVF